MLKNSYVFLASLQICIEIESRKILDASNAEVIGTLDYRIMDNYFQSEKLSEEDRAIFEIFFNDLLTED